MRSRALVIVMIAAGLAWMPGRADAVFTCRGVPITMYGTAGDDVVEGTDGRDVIAARAGDDTIYGFGGDDLICGGGGNDTIHGGPGNDVIAGHAGDDRIEGGDGNDVLLGGRGDDEVLGGAGDDLVKGNLDADHLEGATGDDILYGGPGTDHLRGGSGADRLIGHDGDDRQLGDAGDDMIRGGAGNDILNGGGDDDRLAGGPGNDTLIGADGTDRCVGSDGVDSAESCENVITTEVGQRREPRTRPRPGSVALTFDDGPHPAHTPIVLDILDAYDVKATFFVIGSSVERYPEIVADMIGRGHSVQNHTFGHAWLTRYSNWGIEQQLEDGGAAIAGVVGYEPRCFRPPYGAINSRVRGVASDMGLEPIMWDVDPFDWKTPGSAYVSWHILRYSGDGDVILLHDPSGPSTYNALGDIITGLRDRGLEFDTLCN